MRLPEFGVKKPVTNLMIFTAILLLALYSLTRIGVDLLPEIEPPIISVIAAYPGASPEDVEIKVTEELENQLSTTPGIEKITSYSSEGMSVIALKFLWGTNLDTASNDVRDRIELAKRFLPDIPDEMENPFIFKFNTANIPVLFIGFTADRSYPELYDLLDKRVADSLKQLPGVGAVQFQGGGLQRQINIWINKERLEAYGFSMANIQSALAKENITQPVGNLKTGLTDYLIRLPGEFASPDEINSVILGTRDGKYVYLKDVAKVEDSFKEVTTIVRINQNRGIMMMVQKQSGTNTVEVCNRVKKRLAQLQGILPPDVKSTIIFDTSKDIIDSLNSLKTTIWQAIIMVILVVWFFLRQIKSSLVVALTIPFSLLISFIYIFLSGRTINVISLSAIIIASGLVVDNAIVVVDNIRRHIERGQRVVEASIFGTSEMFLAITASTFTTVVVFVPMLFIPGVVGKMFGELAVITIVTLLASLFTAITFSPMLCSKWFRPEVNNSAQRSQKGLFTKFYNLSEKLFINWENFYAKSLAWCLRRKRLVIFGFLGAFIFRLVLTKFVGNEFFPEEDTGDVRITVHLPIGTRVEETDKVAKRIEQIFINELPEKLYFYSRCGLIPGIGRAMGQSSGSHIISAGAKLVPKTERKRPVKDVANAIRKRIKEIPGVLKTDVNIGNPMGQMLIGGAGRKISLEIIGHSFEETDALAEKIKGILEKIPGAVDVVISREHNRPELKVEIDREKAAVLGLNMHTIANEVKTYIEGSIASRYREKGKTYDIYVRLEENSRSTLEDIENLSILSPVSGKSIKLSNIARIYETAVPDIIERLNRERVVKVECNAYQRPPGKIIEDLNNELKKLIIPQDIILNFGGEAEEQQKAFKDLFLLMILGVALVFMIMAAQFESLLDPFIVMFAIPFTFIGVILAFLITSTTLNVMSYLGMVMLMGIVVNNAIVLISYISILRSRGLSLEESIAVGGKDRLRPVLMTTITTIAGLLPLALSRGEGSESWQPLGITMLGGLSVSTFFTMLFVPTMYAVFETKFKKNKKQQAEDRKQKTVSEERQI
ncbi:MAG: efflux RND transporter permease subunit [Candidatus Omnitrophica bacterium]|nr:efflux RND transporter permease subunit [Candidatus Omnitrophota bacterium]